MTRLLVSKSIFSPLYLAKGLFLNYSVLVKFAQILIIFQLICTFAILKIWWTLILKFAILKFWWPLVTSLWSQNFEHHFIFEPTRVHEVMCKVSHFIHKMNNLGKIKPSTALLLELSLPHALLTFIAFLQA